jgi:hypothetical protein
MTDTSLFSSVGHALACHGERSSRALFLDKLKHVPPRAARGSEVVTEEQRCRDAAPNGGGTAGPQVARLLRMQISRFCIIDTLRPVPPKPSVRLSDLSFRGEANPGRLPAFSRPPIKNLPGLSKLVQSDQDSHETGFLENHI